MKNLTELAQIVSRIKLKPTDLITTKTKSTNKSNIFYQKILQEEFKDENEAARYFYNTDTNHSNYKNLKRLLRKKLINTIFFIDSQKAHSDYERAYIYCSKHMFAAKILIFLHAHSSGVDLCQKVFKKAAEYELTEFIIYASRYLRLHFGSRIGNTKKFEYYNQYFRKYLKVWQMESLAEEYYSRISLPNIQKKATDEQLNHKANEYYQDLAPFLEQTTSPFFHFLTNYMRVLAFFHANDYKAIIDVCENAIQFFEEKPYSYKTPLRVFLHNQLICFTQLKNYNKGKEAARKSAALVRKGTPNWFVNKELHLILAFHSREYKEAVGILNNALNLSKFNLLPTAVQERWLIYEAYIHFLVLIDQVDKEEVNYKKFRMGKFLNSIPTFSKDKRGLNIPILIIQILFMIVRKDYDQTIDRFEAIEKYCSRYLKKDENFRSNCFIKMLLQIPNANFHKVAVERKTEKLYKKLISFPLEVAKQTFEIEIIPYEDLWEFTLNSLEAKIHNMKSWS
jgi:hypothetical protein